MKKLIVLLAVFVLSAALALDMTQPAPGQINFRTDQNNPTHLQVDNLHPSGANIYSEFRANVARVGGGQAAGDFGITGPGYNDGSNLLPNEVFIVSESTAAGIHIKSNGDNYIRGSVGLSPKEIFYASAGGLRVSSDQALAKIELNNIGSNVSVQLLADASHAYVGTKSNHPFHLMADHDAKATVFPSGVLELWEVDAVPTTNPTNGIFLYVEGGALKARGKNGTVTTLASP